MLTELLDGLYVDRFLVHFPDRARGVVGVFDLHADIGGLVECELSLCLFARRYPHE